MKASDINDGKLFSYAVEKRIGEGSFSVVYMAVIQETGEKVAIKKALQEKKYKNRELSNFKILGEHPNIVSLKNAFYVVGQKYMYI
jgi:serine/threonine protein kinase